MHDFARPVRRTGAACAPAQQLGQRQAEEAKAAGLQNVAAAQAVTQAGAVGSDRQHLRPSDGCGCDCPSPIVTRSRFGFKGDIATSGPFGKLLAAPPERRRIGPGRRTHRRPRMARLLLTQGPQAGRQFSLDDCPCTLGRQPGLQIVLDVPEVSRQHARVTQAHGRLFIEDLGSSNGTFLNTPALREKSELRDRDEVQVGPFLLVFHGDAGSEPALFIRAQLQTMAGCPAY